MNKTNTSPPFGGLFTTMTAMVSPTHELITHRPLYGALPPVERRPAARSPAARFVAWLDRWSTRHAQRQRLELKDDRTRRDDVDEG